ncbi:hypothetical protein OAD66_08680 [Bacteroidia bacterium]|nr:hypothetical protein [Bacteroidia bacterium]MDB4107399.1 hypothetical protein [Bacteroidia bacterium]MDB9883191.1 hypothetical protein [Bacteroidia bacterium]
MKNSLVYLLLIVCTIALSLFLPWWIIAPLTFVFAYFSKLTPASGFLISFGAIALAWLLSIYFVDTGAVNILLGKLFKVNAFFTPFIAALLGGLVAGFFGWSGALLAPKKKNWVNG